MTTGTTALTRRAAIQAAGAGLSRAARGQSKRPNILFIMTDDHVPRTLSCYGDKILRTPNFDRLAGEGVRFDNCFCTNSLCAPGRATVLTGCYSHINGVRGNSEAADAIERIDSSLPTFPQLLQRAGYRTGIVGKWHLSHTPAGFDYWCVLPGQGLYFDPDFIENGTRKNFPGYATDVTTDLALQFLRGARQPWCLLYQHKAPHRPFLGPPRYNKLLADVELPYPETYDDDYATRKLAREAEDMRFDVSIAGDYKDLPKDLPPRERKNWIYQRFVKDYYRAVYAIDENLGRVLAHLDKTRQIDDTLILYTSDNGFFLGEHGWYDKRFMYEPSLRIPLIVRGPGVKRGEVVSKMALNLDFAPSILEAAGLTPPAAMQGRSLRPLLEGRAPGDWRTSVYYQYYENSWLLRGKGKEAMTDPSFQYFTPHRVSPHRGVRTERYKLIEYYSEGDYWELFDLHTDPHELKNLHGDPAYARVAADMKKELLRLRRQYRDV